MNKIEELIKEVEDDIFAYPSDSPKEEYAPTSDFKYGYNQASRGFLKSLQKLKRTLDQDIEEQREITDKVIAYDQLDHEFRRVCGKGVQEVLQHITKFGLEVDDHEPVEVPELVAKYLDYARQCLDLNVLTVANYQNVKSNMGKIAADEIVEWAHKHPDEFIEAYQTGDYTVAKEPLYYVPVPHLGEVYYTQDKGGVLDVSYGIGDEFTIKEIKRLFPSLVETVVPVEDE